MTKEQFESITSFVKSHRNAEKILKAVNLILTLTVYVAYPALCLWLLFFSRERLLRCVLVPGIMFVLISAARRLINRPRPYEKLGFVPIITKDKRGQSMPSRHVFSVFVIAMTFLYINPWLSLPFFLIGIILCTVRILGEVHYPSDVIVGAAIGLVSGFVGYFII